MKLTVPFISLVVAAGVAEAAFPHSGRGLVDVHARHARLNQRHEEASAAVSRRGDRRRCKARPASSLESASASSAQQPAKTPEPAKTTEPAKAPEPAKDSPSPKPQNNAAKETTSKAPAAPAKETHASSNSAPSGGVISFAFDQCGSNGATSHITPTTGPNGAEWFLNCGIDGGGWNPPPMTISDLVTVDLGDALKDPNSPFKSCAAYVPLFKQYGGEVGVPATLLASIAMQESSCDPNKTGGAGEQGLMQITKDKCGNAPNGNCKEPWYNIMTGAQFFSSLVSKNGGNVLAALGSYNGWYKGITIAKATAAAHTSCCSCQNNLDYLTQTLNGWLQNRDPSAGPRIGQYFNLDQCNR